MPELDVHPATARQARTEMAMAGERMWTCTQNKTDRRIRPGRKPKPSYER